MVTLEEAWLSGQLTAFLGKGKFEHRFAEGNPCEEDSRPHGHAAGFTEFC